MTGDDGYSVTLTGDGYVSGLAFAKDVEMYSMFEHATMALRWSKEGTLQQEWRIEEHRVGYLGGEKVHFEWRDVPTEAAE